MKIFRTALLVCSVVWGALPAAAQEYPSRPVHLVVPYAAGGIADRVARDVAEELRKRLRQPVVVENRAGASGNIGVEWVVRQPADGHTLLLAPASNLTLQHALFKSLPYDLERDLAPVSLLVQTPQVLLVHKDIAAATPQALAALSKSRPGSVSYGTSLGSYAHLAGELLKARSGGDFTPIPYQGAAPALNDLLGGQTQFGFNEITTSAAHVAAGRLRAVAVADGTRAPQLPDVPTMAELGYPGFEVTSWYALVVRSGTPRPVVDRLATELRAIVQSPAFKERYAALGAYAVGSTPEELAAFIQSETRKWTALARQAGVAPQ